MSLTKVTFSMIDGAAINVQDFGANGDGITDDSAAIQSAIDAAFNAGGQEIFFPAGTYLCASTIKPKRGVVCTAVFGSVTLKLKDAADTTLVESYDFDTLYASSAYQISDNPNMTYDYGFVGFIFDGNKDNQSSTNYLVKMYGRRLVLSNCILANSSGVGLWTALKGSHSGGYDFTKTKTPGDINEIEIVDCAEEAWIFEGPSDQNIGQLVINEIGDASAASQTSTHFSGEEVHGLRVESAMNLTSANLNGVYHGRCLYVNDRITFGDIICAGGWGNAYFDTGAYGQINSLRVQANPYQRSGVAHPSIENLSDDMQFSLVEAARISGQDQVSVPLIKDSGGANWGLVQNRQSLAEGGVFFEAAANVNIASMKAIGADTALNTVSGCSRINIVCNFNNCNTVWDNDVGDIRGAWDFSGALTSGSSQIFATGIDASPNADEESLANARIEFFDNTGAVWKSNSFRGVENFDASTTLGQTIVFTHGMWRTPKVEDISLSMRVSGWAAEPQGACLSINAFDSTTISARIKLTTAATTPLTAQIVCQVI